MDLNSLVDTICVGAILGGNDLLNGLWRICLASPAIH